MVPSGDADLIAKSEAFEMIDRSAVVRSRVPANRQQSEAWNGPDGVHFVDRADRYDRQLKPFTQALLEWAGPEAHHVVLDVGCGSGGSTLAAATRAGRVIGVDFSEPLVELARRRAQGARIGNTEFVIADAQTYQFDAGTFDLVISQFGLMFFDDPVAAFTNIRRALRAGGRATFVSWQGLAANEWLTLIADAVGQHVELPEFGGLSRGPGMFALAQPDDITALLGAAGFEQVACHSCTPEITLGGGGGRDESVDFLFDNPMPRGLLGFVNGDSRDDVLRTVRRQLDDRYQEGIGIRLGAAAWVVTAQAGPASGG
jgi:ubiquinone/menaquinone biosynthesis C-methylase UbiE